MLKELVSWEVWPQEFNILLRRIIKSTLRDYTLSLLRVQTEIPLPSPMLLCPLLDALKVPARVRGRQPWEYTLVYRDVHVEWDGRDVCVAHDCLPQRVYAMIPVPESVGISIDCSIRPGDLLKSAIDLWIQYHSKVVEAV